MAIKFISQKQLRVKKNDEIEVVFISKRVKSKNYILEIEGKMEFVKSSKKVQK